ncbi:MAG: YGGT family protein [Pelotomaculum sp. PtaB.Bin104]|nr:MAG: YGGT family protein [Pelotomaculum sp. PtaB.Bin104]
MEVIITAVDVAFTVYSYLLIFRILLSWFKHNHYQPIIRFVYEITDPYLNIFRKLIPPFGMLDLSPIVALIVLQLLQMLVYRIIVFI